MIKTLMVLEFQVQLNLVDLVLTDYDLEGRTNVLTVLLTNFVIYILFLIIYKTY
jgi:hypothetical protein